ncbi:unnamed protein product [Ceutorhynchus assimilis]|uniref:Small ribosomal subunit protein uS15m n=1 Tax=Ceutorhynchus assimilis TaxID=467358 RepID=A0A9N9QIK9_9CUCU|nr:unnamed protein product [Ceutorhynchus assimilis]
MNKIFSTRVERDLVGLIIRTYAFKSDLKIKWVRPEKIPCYKPHHSGDLVSMPSINKNQYLLEFSKSKELETANDYVKRLFTLEFNPNKCTQKLYIKQNTDKIKRHEYDGASIEVKLARWTGYIRAWQEIMERFPYNKRVKVNLKELIEKRKKHLRYLRKWDYKKFEWILEELNIVYKPSPTDPIPVTRKWSLEKLTDRYCEGIKQERLQELRLMFEREQPAFLEEKIRSLEFIRDEQKECGVEVTVTQQEIDSVKEKLDKLKLKKLEVED